MILLFCQFEIKTICRLMSNCGRLGIISFLLNANEILILKCIEQTLVFKFHRQFGLRSFGHLISNWRRFLRNKILFFLCLCFAMSSLIWRK